MFCAYQMLIFVSSQFFVIVTNRNTRHRLIHFHSSLMLQLNISGNNKFVIVLNQNDGHFPENKQVVFSHVTSWHVFEFCVNIIRQILSSIWFLMLFEVRIKASLTSQHLRKIRKEKKKAFFISSNVIQNMFIRRNIHQRIYSLINGVIINLAVFPMATLRLRISKRRQKRLQNAAVMFVQPKTFQISPFSPKHTQTRWFGPNLSSC